MIYKKAHLFRKNAAGKILPRQTFPVDLPALNIPAGLIAVIAVAGTLITAACLRMPDIALGSLGALYICLAVPGGGVRSDLAPLLTLSLGGGLAFALFPLLRTLPEIYILPAAFLTLTVILLFYGARQPWGISVMLIASDVLIALDLPAPDIKTAFWGGGLYAGGSLLATVLFMIVWRFYPARPVKRKINRIYRLLANDLRDIAGFTETPLRHRAAWERHLTRSRYALRASLEETREIIAAFLKYNPKNTEEVNKIVTLFNAAEELFSLSAAFENEAEFSEHKDPHFPLILRRLAFITDKISELSKKGPKIRTAPLQHLSKHIEQAELLFSKTSDAATGRKICHILREALAFSRAKPPAELALQNIIDRPASFLTVVKARLNPKSLSFRNGMRISLLCTLALTYTLRHATIDQHWVAFAILFIVQPYSLSSVSKLSERVIGTLAGAFIATLIAYFFPSQLILIPVFIIFSFFSVAFRAVNYGTHIFLVTPLVIFLMTVAFPGTPETAMASARIIYTLEGGALALIGSALLWPEKAVRDLKTETDKVITAMQAFIPVAFESLITGVRAESFLRKQRLLGLAGNNLDVMLSRALHEASGKDISYIENTLKAGTTLRRMTGCLVSLQHFSVSAEEKKKLITLQDLICSRLRKILHEEYLSSPPSPPVFTQASEQRFSSETLQETLTALVRQTEILQTLYHKRAD